MASVDVTKHITFPGRSRVAAREDASHVARWTIGDERAYKALRGILLADPIGGDDWRIALDALSVVASTKPEFGVVVYEDLKKFARDRQYFGSDKVLKGAPCIGAAEAAAKVEVPVAMAILIRETQKSTNSTDVPRLARKSLKEAGKTSYWANIQWCSKAYYGQSADAKWRLAVEMSRRSREEMRALSADSSVQSFPARVPRK